MTVQAQPTYSFQKAPIQLTFVIVGAGLGGVAASICLKLSGHNVILLEAATELGEVGAGIQIPPPSTKILKAIGVLDAIEKVSIHPHDILIKRYKGELLSTQNLVPYVSEKYDGLYLHIHRADYHKALVNRAEELGVQIHTNSRVVDVDFENTIVTTLSGETYTGDVIVGYDGVRSHTRALLTGDSTGAYDTGDLAYRALINVDDMKKVPGLEKFYANPNINFWWGPTMHIVMYFLQQGQVCNVVALCPDTLPQGVLRQEASHDELLDLVKDWDEDLTTVFKLITSISKWRLQDSRELKTWVNHKTGNFIILGDASHSTLPYLASGASQAVEDAAVLAGLFSKIESHDQIPQILTMTESLRKWRSSQVVRGSHQCQDIYHLPDGELQEIRDSYLYDKTPELGCPNRFADPVFQDFLWGYNAFEEVERAWKEFKAGGNPSYTYPNLYKEKSSGESSAEVEKASTETAAASLVAGNHASAPLSATG
ncbi:hypothetical protein KGF57_002722 [Candida theae]|uniref:FAD-binding domain-containing protein n=1 Tax=Candida theae TaxID=1198502 RepID=A0AAD5FYW1_9ASCO|nr:uncharacterized protein KGF57_002722 [Candida theae]KAI5958365.1 hypothetical protein KGF57_002722 [Candida theae]